MEKPECVAVGEQELSGWDSLVALPPCKGARTDSELLGETLLGDPTGLPMADDLLRQGVALSERIEAEEIDDWRGRLRTWPGGSKSRRKM